MPQYVMSREDRTTALEELQACKDYLWDGKSERSEEFICNAIKEIYCNEKMTTPATELIRRSLTAATGDAGATYQCFFRQVNPNIEFTNASLQAERLRWVNHLIDSLKESLK